MEQLCKLQKSVIAYCNRNDRNNVGVKHHTHDRSPQTPVLIKPLSSCRSHGISGCHLTPSTLPISLKDVTSSTVPAPQVLKRCDTPCLQLQSISVSCRTVPSGSRGQGPMVFLVCRVGRCRSNHYCVCGRNYVNM